MTTVKAMRGVDSRMTGGRGRWGGEVRAPVIDASGGYRTLSIINIMVYMKCLRTSLGCVRKGTKSKHSAPRDPPAAEGVRIDDKNCLFYVSYENLLTRPAPDAIRNDIDVVFTR